MKQNSRRVRRCITCLVVFAGLFGCFFLAAGVPATESTESGSEGVYYVVRQGDTLWAVSGHFYHDPFLWPFVWANNPYIDNPHWIFPGNRIFLADAPWLPQGLAGFPGTESAIGEAIVRQGGVRVPESVADTSVVCDEPMKPQGWVVASDDDGVMLYAGETVYLNMVHMNEVAEGDTYQVLRKGRELKHPNTGKKVGTLYHVLGYAKVLDPGDTTGITTARLVNSNDPIQIGDFLRKHEMPSENAFYSKPSEQVMNGYVIANVQDPLEMGQHDICVIDKGSQDGVEVGDTFWILEPGKLVKGFGRKARHSGHSVDGSEKVTWKARGKKVHLPPKKIGQLVVIRTEKVASTALVTESDTAFQAGAPVLAKVD